jgi:hypothetical protein
MIEQEYKGYLIKSSPSNPKSWLIQNMKRGGSLPIVFDGLFTDRHTAMSAIDTYMERKEKVYGKAGTKE